MGSDGVYIQGGLIWKLMDGWISPKRRKKSDLKGGECLSPRTKTVFEKGYVPVYLPKGSTISLFYIRCVFSSPKT